jgi:hypothetical protein
MGDVAQWLEERGLGQYAAVFADNDIEFDVLCRLSDQDLNWAFLWVIAGSSWRKSPSFQPRRPQRMIPLARLNSRQVV